MRRQSRGQDFDTQYEIPGDAVRDTIESRKRKKGSLKDSDHKYQIPASSSADGGKTSSQLSTPPPSTRKLPSRQAVEFPAAALHHSQSFQLQPLAHNDFNGSTGVNNASSQKRIARSAVIDATSSERFSELRAAFNSSKPRLNSGSFRTITNQPCQLTSSYTSETCVNTMSNLEASIPDTQTQQGIIQPFLMNHRQRALDLTADLHICPEFHNDSTNLLDSEYHIHGSTCTARHERETSAPNRDLLLDTFDNSEDIDRGLITLDTSTNSSIVNIHHAADPFLQNQEGFSTIRPAMDNSNLDADDEFPLDDMTEEDLSSLLVINEAHRAVATESNREVLVKRGSCNAETQLSTIGSRSPAVMSTSSVPGRAISTNFNRRYDCNSNDASQMTSCEVLNSGPDSCPGKAHQQKFQQSRVQTNLLPDPPNEASEMNVQEGEDDSIVLQPFARPEFPPRIRDQSPIIGITSSRILRICFRVGEACRASSVCHGVGQNAILEVFVRVLSSFRIPDTSRQVFEFGDLFHDRPPYLKGVLEDYRISTLQEMEGRKLLDRPGQMVRCLGRLKRELNASGWTIDILNVRVTDWEEIRWAKNILEFE